MPALVLTVTPILVSEAAGKGEKEGGHDDDGGYPSASPTDLIITGALLEEAAQKLAAASEATEGLSTPSPLSFVANCGALIIRTLPNGKDKMGRQWSGTNPPYPTASAAKWALAKGCWHLLLDLPSTDKENDQGLLVTHRTWWGLPPRSAGGPSSPPEDGASKPLSRRTITELCYVPPSVPDGPYLLDLQVAPVELDAAPSRPLLFPVRRKTAAAASSGTSAGSSSSSSSSSSS